MNYYISWTHSDPIYQQYLHHMRILVSPPNVSQAWQIGDWTHLPVAAIIDSGAFQYYRTGQNPSPEAVLSRQLRMGAGQTLPIGMCHLDVPLLGTRNLVELERRLTMTLSNARWLMEHLTTQALPIHVSPIGVIQGYSVERVYVVAQTLADMGYTTFAIGSLAGMVAHDKSEVLRRVEAALEAVGTSIHVLGVSSFAILADLARLGIESADSGAPIHEAWRGGILYSQPLRRYKLASPHFQEWRRSYSFAEILDRPLPCDCPVCREDSTRLMQPRGKTFVNLRAIHNCYHLMREISSLPT
jgi:7-cyano-7-deazaguanine tRNA-ribosyltransferase